MVEELEPADPLRALPEVALRDEEAERRTRSSGEAWFWSRSRQEYWHKGATSGNTMAVEELRDERLQAARLLDARRPRTGVTLEPITQEQPGDRGDAWSATGGAIALGALITIASE